MNDVHANKYKLLIFSEVGNDYVMRYQFPFIKGVGITTEFIEQ